MPFLYMFLVGIKEVRKQPIRECQPVRSDWGGRRKKELRESQIEGIPRFGLPGVRLSEGSNVNKEESLS